MNPAAGLQEGLNHLILFVHLSKPPIVVCFSHICAIIHHCQGFYNYKIEKLPYL
jgi:hypothetical protein